MAKTDYTRVELIDLCQQATVPQEVWQDRDSAAAQRQVGECLMLLKAGCRFEVLTAQNAKPSARASDLITDHRTIWVEVHFDGFQSKENGEHEWDHDTFYLPTLGRLKMAGGSDWY